MTINNSEVIIYQANDKKLSVDVLFYDETVWLTQAQIAELFGIQRQAITKHLKNIFNDGELLADSVSSKMELTAQDGKNYKTSVYNLDAILSVGYRVNSKNATQFRIWANKILKDYLLKGYAINNRMNRLEDNVESLKTKVNEIDLQINTHLIPTQGVFFDGQVFDAYALISKVIRSAKNNIILIDNYIDDTTLTHLAKKKKDVKVLLLVKNIGKQLSLDIQKANAQYGNFDVKQFIQSHDRFLIIDNGKEVYHIGASLKDLGRKWFAFSRLDKSSVASILNMIWKLI
jgi:prophage antirepressor-like protein